MREIKDTMIIYAFALCVLLILSLSTITLAYDASPFGINGLKFAHARHDPNLWSNAAVKARVMKEAGIYWDRLEIWWASVEPEQGKFDWSYYDKVAKFYREHGLNGIVILCYSSAWSRNTPPIDDAERKRFANYVYETVKRYKDTFKVWEIWNEPNIPTFWAKPDVRAYTLLLKEAYQAAKRADPECTVLAACTSGPGNDFILGIYENGGWDYCDAISIHPYSMSGGPIAQQFDRILRILREQLVATGDAKPIWITEMGWTTPDSSMDEPQASYLVQSYIISLANGIEKYFWFCLDDWGEKWGIVRNFDPFEPKPSYEAYKRMTRYLGSPGRAAQFEGYLKMPAGVACYVFRKPSGERILILWATEYISRDVQLPRHGELKAEDILGRQVEINRGRLTVGTTPIIVSGSGLSRIGPISSTSPYIESKRQNLVNNGTLNVIHDGKPGWWNPGRFDGTAKEGKIEVSTEGRWGTVCVSISQSGERAAWDATPIPVRPGRRYRATAWIRTENATGNNQIALFWYSGDMWHYIREDRSESVTGTNGWKKIGVTAVAPKGSAFVRVNLISEKNSGKVWFDDIALVEE
ncbi:MAG: glycosyl hydrolase [Armatimonadota bacterium]|nr:glycosyl hydrolase [Armatimonadota bacterium]